MASTATATTATTGPVTKDSDESTSANPERNGGMRLRRSTRSDFNLEPNPFEQSFRTPHSSSNLRQASAPDGGRSPSPNTHNSSGPSSNGSGHHTDGTAKPKGKSETPPPVLPPVATIASPADPNHFGSWGFSPSLANSLRSGPLSPAMLAGPQMGGNGHLNYDQSSFRTGFTPRTGLTPRTGMTPGLGSGLTPLIGGPVSFPPPSPNTAAFLALMNSNSSNMHSSSGNLQPSTTITPNTFSAITGGAFNPNMMNKNGNQQDYGNSQNNNNNNSNNQDQHQTDSENNAAAAASYAASTAADGLFLLSQAHQELTKRDEAARAANASKEAAVAAAAAAAASGPKATNNRKRKASSAAAPTKRTRTSARARVSPDYEEDEDDDDSIKEFSMKDAKGETEEEKRKNFLERNRQAALKCRQRKKAWLAQLQGQNEYLKAENERLTSALVAAREEVARLSALNAGQNSGPAKPAPGQPVSVNVPVGKSGAPTGSGAPPQSSNTSAAAASATAATNGTSARSGYGY